MDKYQIEEISNKLKGEIPSKAAISAVANAVPISGIGIAADLAMLIQEIPYYLAEFQIHDAAIRRYSADLNVPFEDLANELVFSKEILLGKIAVREFAIWFIKDKCKQKAVSSIAKVIPFIGSAVAAGVAYCSTGYLLDTLINTCKEDAHRLSRYVSSLREQRERRNIEEQNSGRKGFSWKKKFCCCFIENGTD